MIKKDLDNYQKLSTYTNLIEEELLKVLTGVTHILKNLDTEESKKAFDKVNEMLRNHEIIRKDFLENTGQFAIRDIDKTVKTVSDDKEK